MIENKKSKLVVVLGMHRSGTSAISRGLRVMGVELGDRMMPPVKGNNPTGFWEDVDINALNIEILELINNPWFHLTAIDSNDVESLCKEDYFSRATELLCQKLSNNAPAFGFKDPRVAKLLLFWREVFSHSQLDLCYVLVVRNPLSIVRSLYARDGIEAEHGYLLWLSYVIKSLTETVSNNRVLVDYDRLMQSPDHELLRIAECVGLTINPTELQIYKSEFLDPELRHTIYELKDLLLDDSCPPIVQEMYADLLDVASDKVGFDDEELLNKVVSWADEFERLKTPLRLVDKLLREKSIVLAEHNDQLSNLDQVVAERDGQLANLEQTISDQVNHIRNVEAEHEKRGEQIAGLEQTISDQVNHIRNVEAEHEKRGEQIAGLEQTISDQVDHIRNVEAEHEKRGEQIASLEQTVVD